MSICLHDGSYNIIRLSFNIRVILDFDMLEGVMYKSQMFYTTKKPWEYIQCNTSSVRVSLHLVILAQYILISGNINHSLIIIAT